MWNVLKETVHKYVYAVNKQVLIKRRDWCKELRSNKNTRHQPPQYMA